MNRITIRDNSSLPYGVREALNRLRVNIGFFGKDYKKIVITSSVPEEGKSFISNAIAQMLAEAGHKVCLIDADIRKSRMRTASEMQIEGNDSGRPYDIVSYLSGKVEAREVLYSTNIENLHVIPVLVNVANPALLFQNKRFELILQALSDEFDYILIDTPPLGSVADGDLIASHCDGAILVVRSGSTSRTQIASSLKQIQNANCTLLGCVLNRINYKNTNYYYKYSKKGYSYYYGSGNSNNKKAK